MKGSGKEGKHHPAILLAEKLLSKALKEVFGSNITYDHIGIYIYFERLARFSGGHDLRPKVFEGKCRLYRIKGKWRAHFIQVDSEGMGHRYDDVWPEGILALRPERDPTAPRPVLSRPI